MNITKRILGAVILGATLVQFAAAAPLPALFYVSAFDVSVGDTVSFNLKVNPDATKPVFTVGATMKYDPEYLSFQTASIDGAWTPVAGTPNEVTDTTFGTITRTGKYTNGLNTVAKFTDYSFKALKQGETKIVISEGVALGADNVDSGLQVKTITVRIGLPKETPVVTKKNLPQTLTLDIFGSTALYSTEDYNFTINHNPKVAQPTTATTSITVFDEYGNESYKTEQSFVISANTSVLFKIPSGSLRPGDYSMVVNTKYSDQKTPLTVTKSLGVLAKVDNVIEKEVPTPYIPLYVYPMFLILLLIIGLMILHKRNRKFRTFLKNF